MLYIIYGNNYVVISLFIVNIFIRNKLGRVYLTQAEAVSLSCAESYKGLISKVLILSLIHISEPTRPY